MQGDTRDAPYWWTHAVVIAAFPGWTIEYTERALIMEQERGWPIRNMMMLRAFEGKWQEVRAAEKPGSSTPLPQDAMAKRVYAARLAANEGVLREFQGERLTPKEILAKVGVKAE